MIKDVAIIGAGFSGSLHAINLLRHEGPRATLIERSFDAGTGVAYGSAHPTHLLNVRAANMSAFPDQPDHFVQWLEQRGRAGAATSFVPRLVYGAYLRALLDEAVDRSAGRLTLVRGDVVDVRTDDAVQVQLADGRAIGADAAVLALGNLPPHALAGSDEAALAAVYKPDPWARDATAGLGRDDTVLIVGTGLTMVDVALKLEAEGFAGRVVAISRRGLLPRAHADLPAARRIDVRPPTTSSALIREVRRRSAAVGWRNAVDELRPFTQSMWRAADRGEHARFLRHLRAWWDVHRHRIAPPVAERLDALRAAGRLRTFAGRLQGIDLAGDGALVSWRPRGADRAEQLRVTRIINCTGPQGDLFRTSDPLLSALACRGVIRPDSCRLGIDVTAQAETIDASGRISDRVFAIGPMTRGAFWEIVAVPDIREQAWTLARRLSNAHWTGGEGL